MTIAAALRPLPPAFTSVYRLFLRAISSSVSHHRRHTRELRKLYRPAFQQAAAVIRQLENGPPNPEPLSKWLQNWQDRVDNTLSFLANSTVTRGLPHNLTRNLGTILYRSPPRFRKRLRWNPKMDPSSKAYKPKSLNASSDDVREFSDECFGALGELVMMAEGRHNITLGKIVQQRRER